ncbi:MAG: hypothetical protein AMXMBFR78_33110 [Rubrivivax sp.]
MRRLPALAALLVVPWLVLQAPVAQAMGFAEAFDAARSYDAQYRAAGHERDSARLGVPIARSYLLPSISLSASSTEVEGHRRFGNSLNQEVRLPMDYSAPQAALQLRAPLLNYEALLRLRMARAQADSAQTMYEIRELELADRLGTAYLQVLLSTEGVKLARAEIVQLEGQLDRSRRRLDAGEGTRTEVAQTQAQLELARVRLVEALDQSGIARRGLQRFIGQAPLQLEALANDYRPAELEPPELDAWQALAEQRNPLLRVRAQNVDMARLATQRARASHLPRLDLVASLSHSKNESISSLNQTSSLRSVGLQLSVPIYSGGGIDATVKQTVADGERIQEELRNERESVQFEIQRQFLLARNGHGKVDGFLRAVQASELTLQGMTRAVLAGMATSADVLDAQTRVFASRRDLAQARYEYLAARLRLSLQSGTPIAEAIGEIDRQLTQAVTLEDLASASRNAGGTR